MNILHTHISIIFMMITCTVCYSNYDIFEGFDKKHSHEEKKFQEEIRNNQSGEVDTIDKLVARNKITTDKTSETLPSSVITRLNTVSSNTMMSPSTNSTLPTTYSSANSTSKPKTKTKVFCPEEIPMNIGSYEVPTEKDIVIFTKDLLLSMFETYERDAMALLLDIKEATKAAVIAENKCPYNRHAYRQCVKRVSGQSEGVTKGLVISLQLYKIDVADLTDDAICSLSEMKSDPMLTIKLLAQETAMHKFALPGFLRLLNSCFDLCSISSAFTYGKKPLHRITDQELVVKHFLTNKNYSDLIKDSRRNV